MPPPITLIVDLTYVDAKQASSLNDIFDQPISSYAGRPLGKNVTLIAVITPKMVFSPQLSTDFMSRLPSCYRPDLGTISPKIELIPIAMTPNWPVVTLFNDSETAIETIVGSPGIGPNGQLTAIPGPLIKAIMDNNAGLIISDPPKNDCKFDSWIATVITDKRLPFNGTSVIIPDDFQFIFATGIPETELVQLRQRTVSRWNGQICDLTLTSDTVHLLYPTVHIGSDHKVHLTPGLSGTKIKIVGPLSPSQWVKLLHHLPKTAEVTISNSTPTHFLQHVGITVHHDYHPDNAHMTISSDISYTSGVHGIHTTDPDFTLHQMQGVPESRIIIDISRAMDTDAPFQSVTVHSFKDRQLSSTDTELIHHLENGTPLILRGCEANPSLMRYLHTLFETPPYLLLNGQCRRFPNANVTILSPPSMTTQPTIERFRHHPITSLDRLNATQLPSDAKMAVINLQAATGLKLSWGLLNRIQTTAQSQTWQTAVLRHILPMLKSTAVQYAYAKCLISATLETANSVPALNQKKLHQLASRELSGQPVSKWEWATAFKHLPWEAAPQDFDIANFPPHLFSMMVDAILSIGPRTDAEKAVLSKLFPSKNTSQSEWQLLTPPLRHFNEMTQVAEQLAEQIQNTSARLFFLQGNPGTGKSHVATQLQSLIPELELIGPITVGPDISFESLVGSVQKTNDSAQFIAGKLIQFATSTAKFPVLFVNEANLPPIGFWNLIRGLFDTPPQLVINGILYPLKNHKIIFTGNFDEFSGRVADPVILAHAEHIAVPPMSPTMTQNLITHELSHIPVNQLESRHHATLSNVILEIERVLTHCLPRHEFTIRDPKDWVHRTHIALRTRNSSEPATLKTAIATLINCVMDSIGHELPTEQRTQFREWLVERHKCHAEWEATIRHDLATWVQLKPELESAAPHINFDSDDTRDLALLLFKSLQIQAFDKAETIPNRGKRGLLIQGPPARGKDVLYTAFRKCPRFEASFKQAIHMTCKVDSDYELLIREIEQAKKSGHIIALSEANLLPPATIEGHLNDALTGETTAGFHAFVFQNDPSLSGRSPLTPSLESRFNIVKIDDYSEASLKTSIVPTWLNTIPDSQKKNDFISSLLHFHFEIERQCRLRNSSLHPTNRQLIEACNRYSAVPDQFTDHQQRELMFRHVYSLYIPSAIRGRPHPDNVLAKSIPTPQFELIAAGFDYLSPINAEPVLRALTDRTGPPPPPPYASRFEKEVWRQGCLPTVSIDTPILEVPNSNTAAQHVSLGVENSAPKTEQNDTSILPRTPQLPAPIPTPDPRPAPSRRISFPVWTSMVKFNPCVSNHNVVDLGPVDYNRRPIGQRSPKPLDTRTGKERLRPIKIAETFSNSVYNFERHGALQRIKVDSSGFRVKPIKMDLAHPISNWVQVPNIPQQADLIPSTPTHHLGEFRVDLKKNRWVPIPSWVSEQEVLGYHCRPQARLQFAKNGAGQWAVRSHETQTVTLQQLIDSRHDINSGRRMLDSLPNAMIIDYSRLQFIPLPKELRTVFDALQITTRLEISEADSPIDTINKIARYCQNFQEKRLPTMQEIGIDQPTISTLNRYPNTHDLVRMIIGQSGVCRHRAQCALALATYLGIPAQVQTNYVHEYLELPVIQNSIRGFAKLDLGGGGSDWQIEVVQQSIVAISPNHSDNTPGHQIEQQLAQCTGNINDEKVIKHILMTLFSTPNFRSSPLGELPPNLAWLYDLKSKDSDVVITGICTSIQTLSHIFDQTLMHKMLKLPANTKIDPSELGTQLIARCATQLSEASWIHLVRKQLLSATIRGIESDEFLSELQRTYTGNNPTLVLRTILNEMYGCGPVKEAPFQDSSDLSRFQFMAKYALNPSNNPVTEPDAIRIYFTATTFYDQSYDDVTSSICKLSLSKLVTETIPYSQSTYLNLMNLATTMQDPVSQIHVIHRLAEIKKCPFTVDERVRIYRSVYHLNRITFWGNIITETDWRIARNIIEPHDCQTLWEKWIVVNPTIDCKVPALEQVDVFSFVGLIMSHTATQIDFRKLGIQFNLGLPPELLQIVRNRILNQSTIPPIILEIDQSEGEFAISAQLIDELGQADFFLYLSKTQFGTPSWYRDLSNLAKFAIQDPIVEVSDLCSALSAVLNGIKDARDVKLSLCKRLKNTLSDLLGKVPNGILPTQLLLDICHHLDLPERAYQIASDADPNEIVQLSDQNIHTGITNRVRLENTYMALPDPEKLSSVTFDEWIVDVNRFSADIPPTSPFLESLLMACLTSQPLAQKLSSKNAPPLGVDGNSWLKLINLAHHSNPRTYSAHDLFQLLPTTFRDSNLSHILISIRSAIMDAIPATIRDILVEELFNLGEGGQFVSWVDSDTLWTKLTQKNRVEHILEKNPSIQNLMWDNWQQRHPGEDPKGTAVQLDPLWAAEGLFRSPSGTLNDFRIIPHDRRILSHIQQYMVDYPIGITRIAPASNIISAFHVIELDPDTTDRDLDVMASYYVHYDTTLPDQRFGINLFRHILDEFDHHPDRFRDVLKFIDYHIYETNLLSKEALTSSVAPFFLKNLSEFIRQRLNMEPVLHFAANNPACITLRQALMRHIEMQFMTRSPIPLDTTDPYAPCIEFKPKKTPPTTYKWAGATPPDIKRLITAKPAFPVKKMETTGQPIVVLIENKDFFFSFSRSQWERILSSTTMVTVMPTLEMVEIGLNRERLPNTIKDACQHQAFHEHLSLFQDALAAHPNVYVWSRNDLLKRLRS